MDPILVDVNVHPTKLEVRLSKEEQLYQLIVATEKAVKDRILIPKNNLDYVPKKNKVLHSFEQQKIEFEQRQKHRRIIKRRRFHLKKVTVSHLW